MQLLPLAARGHVFHSLALACRRCSRSAFQCARSRTFRVRATSAILVLVYLQCLAAHPTSSLTATFVCQCFFIILARTSSGSHLPPLSTSNLTDRGLRPYAPPPPGGAHDASHPLRLALGNMMALRAIVRSWKSSNCAQMSTPSPTTRASVLSLSNEQP